MNLSTGSKVFLGLLAVLAISVVGFLQWANSQLEPAPDVASEPVTFVVETGVGRSELAAQLEQANVIRNATSFDLYARQDGFFASLAAGTYDLETNMSADEVVEVFREGPQRAEEDQFRVEEGLSQVLTIERLGEQFEDLGEDAFQSALAARLDAGGNEPGVLQVPDGLPDPADFGPEVRFPFEGLLWPETYRVDEGADPQAILQRMVNELDEKLREISAEEQTFLEERGLSVYEAMIVASLIERETRVDDERSMVASVIYNRLDAEMPLQIDATVLYALDKWKERVLIEDTNVESPYNTYQVQGLPPTPISGFGEASLKAALNPDDTDFRYYVLTPECDGSHVFAQTLDEHNSNVAAFREVGGCRDDG